MVAVKPTTAQIISGKKHTQTQIEFNPVSCAGAAQPKNKMHTHTESAGHIRVAQKKEPKTKEYDRLVKYCVQNENKLKKDEEKPEIKKQNRNR